MTRRLSGIVPPLVTPLQDRDALDQAGLERLIEHVVGGGVHGLFILGTTGEAPSLSYRLRREFISRVCQLAQERLPVLVGITDTSFVESVTLARHAADAGAMAVVLSTPYYFPAGQTESGGDQRASHVGAGGTQLATSFSRRHRSVTPRDLAHAYAAMRASAPAGAAMHEA